MNETTPSEHRLHPLSILFQLLGQIRALIVPALLVFFGARSTGLDWEVWGPVLLVPYAAAGILRYATFRYRYDATEFVIRWGLFVRRERHIPYARIQNIDAVETLLHRLLGVVDVRLQTAAGSEPEAVLSVLPAASVAEMRRQVFARAGRRDHEETPDASAPAPAPLLVLSPRDLVVYGFIENRGMVIVAAVAGVLWDVGVLNGLMQRLVGEEAARRIAETLARESGVPLRRLLMLLAAVLAVLLFIRVLSMGWALVRLHGFTLTRAGEDLQVRFGLLTRVSATVPLGRVQAVTIREGPWHRLLGRASVRVTTAGGSSGEAASVQREWIAPILRRERLAGLVAEILPHFDLAGIDWQQVDRRAVRRRFRAWLVFGGIVSAALLPRLWWWTLPVAGALVVWSAFVARRQIANLGWTTTDQAVAFRRGWIWRVTTITPLSRIQAVARHESPFDRRYRMARVRVDTAGASEPFRVDVPYLARDVATALHGRLAAAAAETAFRW